MSWEQMSLPLFPDPATPPAPPQQRAIQRREPDDFDAWIQRRSEFDKAFLRGLRMSSEQTMIDNIVRAGQPADSNKPTTKKTDQERKGRTSGRPAVKLPCR